MKMEIKIASAVHQTKVPVLNPAEAPVGYYAVLKRDVVTESLGNICRACDWRSACNGFEHRCSPCQIQTADGRLLTRNDGCSVVYKRLPSM